MAKVTIVAEVSQRSAVLAGKKEYGRMFVEIDPEVLSEQQREMLVGLGTDGASDHPGFNYKISMGSYGDPTIENIQKQLDELSEITKVNKEKRKEEAEKEVIQKAEKEKERVEFAERFLADTSLQASSWDYGNAIFDSGSTLALKYMHTFLSDTPVAIEAKKRLEADREAERAEEEKMEAEKEKVRQAKKDYLDAWISEHGTESQEERHGAGLLPSEELFGAITDHIFAPLKDEEHYIKMQESDCSHSERCDEYGNEGCDVDWEVEDASGATAEEWERMKFLKKKLSRENATVALRIHTGKTDCKITTEKKGILIEIEEGGYTFSREYAV